MKKIYILIVLLAFVGTSCKYFPNKKKKEAEQAAMQKAKEDSIKKAKKIEADNIRMAQEKARQDSVARANELNSKFHYHVIIGSFKVPSNAVNWQKEVNGMGYSNTTILHASNGFDLVSIGDFETFGKAYHEIGRINSDKEEPVELWIYDSL